MPDWSYRTVFRPLLFRLPPIAARDFTLGVMGMLGRSAAGRLVIDILGHMGPDPRLKITRDGIDFPSATGFGAGIDVGATALSALARFGFGFIEVGPVSAQPLRRGGLKRYDDDQSIAWPDPPDNPGAAALADRLRRGPALRLPILARLAVAPGASPEAAAADVRDMCARLAPRVAAFTLDLAANWDEDGWAAFLDGVATTGPKVWLVLRADLDPETASRRSERARAAGIGGVVVDGTVSDHAGSRRLGAPARAPARALVRFLRARFPDGLTIAASGGVHDPADALDLRDAGADLVVIDSGLVFSGPGLPKRVNEALLHADHAEARDDAASHAKPPRPAAATWLWFLLMGLSMALGSAIALAIAATRVVLPYDEQFVGLDRHALAAVNPRLLPFMSHDRVTLAGTMLTIGVMYTGLSWFGVRRGVHWAMVTVEASAFAGFFSFFLFLGFGYFDPFHAFVTAALLQLLLLGIHSNLSPPAAQPAPGLREDGRWRRSLWGQLLFVVQASAFLVAGLVISGVGITSVFVPEDLQFMHTDAHTLGAASPHLLPLIAHDRASFGGMLVSSGLAFLLSTLWGFRRGAAWLWWTTLAAGVPGYAAAIGVHFAVGYENLWHLTPAFAGAVLFGLGLALSYPYLCLPDPPLEEEWARRCRGSARALL